MKQRVIDFVRQVLVICLWPCAPYRSGRFIKKPDERVRAITLVKGDPASRSRGDLDLFVRPIETAPMAVLRRTDGMHAHPHHRRGERVRHLVDVSFRGTRPSVIGCSLDRSRARG